MFSFLYFTIERKMYTFPEDPRRRCPLSNLLNMLLYTVILYTKHAHHQFYF